MHIKYVLNQHHCDTIKYYLDVGHENFKKRFYFQYIKFCL
jgi:hypothetical protein